MGELVMMDIIFNSEYKNIRSNWVRRIGVRKVTIINPLGNSYEEFLGENIRENKLLPGTPNSYFMGK